MKLITQQELKEILHYEPTTGCFKWLRTKRKYCGSKEHKGYITIQINCNKYKAHRLAWLYVYGYLPTLQIDHINGIKDDNRILNLREATNSQNLINKPLNKNNKTGYKGVSYEKINDKFKAQIAINGKKINLGRFNSAKEASIAYINKCKEVYGEFNWSN